MKIYNMLTLILVLSVSLASCKLLTKPLEKEPILMEWRRAPQTEVEKLDLCPTCIDFAGQFINQLLNIVLNVGVVGTCGEVCGILEQKVNNTIVGTVCTLLCDIVGIEAFIKIIEKADLDPIYYCELLTVCKIIDNGDANITSLVITPLTVPKGSTFTIAASFKTMNGTGTGVMGMTINTMDGIPLSNDKLMMPLAPGEYTVQATVSAEPDSNCDPTQGPCELWIPGNYSVTFVVCNGECGSKHPHSKEYDEMTKPFTVTN